MCGVEVTPPCLDQHLGLGKAEESLAVKQFAPELEVKAFEVAGFFQARGG